MTLKVSAVCTVQQCPNVKKFHEENWGLSQKKVVHQQKDEKMLFFLLLMLLFRSVCFFARSRRMWMTHCLCYIGCSDLKLRHLSEWDGLRYTAESKWPLGERLIHRSKNRRHPSFSFSIVNWNGAFYCVQMCQEFGQLWFFHDHKSGIYISFPQTRRICKGFQSSCFSFSMTKFVTTDEMGAPIAVPKTCL